MYYRRPLLIGAYMCPSVEETLPAIDSMLSHVPDCYLEYSRGRIASYRNEAKAIHERSKAAVTPFTPATL